MAKTVNSSFDEFLKNTINLDPEDTKKAKSSRDWLVTRIHEFPDKNETFPDFYDGKDICFGSFARKTKKRALDDIDMIICLSGDYSTYLEYSDKIQITVPETATNLKTLCNDGTNTLNSRKVINKFISELSNIPQYQKAELKLNKQAAVLNLSSYDWSFDIVPGFFTVPDTYGKAYYLIPDGKGDWMKTDPRIDRDRVSTINQANEGNVLNVIRIIKYWNKRPTMPSMGSYLLENMILDYYDGKINSCSKYVDLEVRNILSYISSKVYLPVNDPKGIQGDLNNLTAEERSKISSRAYSDYLKAIDAINYETNKKQKESINKWKEIFGSEFPEYDGE